jgi:hypothetical protein
MNDTRIMDCIANSLDELGCKYDRRDNDDIRVNFTGDYSRYTVWFTVDQFGPDRVNLRVRAYTALSGDRRKPIPAIAVEPGRLAQLQVLLNLINQTLRCGAFYIDRNDSDLTFSWAIPLEAEPTTDLVDFALGMADAIDVTVVSVRAVVIEGKPAWEVYSAQRDQVDASYAGRGESVGGDAPAPEPLEVDDPDGWDDTDGDDAEDGPTPFRRAV